MFVIQQISYFSSRFSKNRQEPFVRSAKEIFRNDETRVRIACSRLIGAKVRPALNKSIRGAFRNVDARRGLSVRSATPFNYADGIDIPRTVFSKYRWTGIKNHLELGVSRPIIASIPFEIARGSFVGRKDDRKEPVTAYRATLAPRF